jgi:hypothetical protein
MSIKPPPKGASTPSTPASSSLSNPPPQQVVQTSSSTTPSVRPIVPDVAFWGVPGAGKTTFLAASMHMFETKEIRYNLDIPLHIESDYPDVYTISREFYNELKSKFAAGDVTRAATLPGSATQSTPLPYVLSYKGYNENGSDSHSYLLSWMDVSGETVANERDEYHPYWTNFRKSKAGILIINAPDAKKNSYGYDKWLGTLKINLKKSAPYLAVCMHHMDRWPGVNGPRDVESLKGEEILKDCIGESGLNLIRAAAGYDPSKPVGDDKVKIFLTSAIGWYKDTTGQWKRNQKNEGEVSELVEPRSHQTYNILNAMAWVLDKIDDVRLKEHRQSRPQLIKLNKRLRKTNQRILDEIREHLKLPYPL